MKLSCECRIFCLTQACFKALVKITVFVDSLGILVNVNLTSRWIALGDGEVAVLEMLGVLGRLLPGIPLCFCGGFPVKCWVRYSCCVVLSEPKVLVFSLLLLNCYVWVSQTSFRFWPYINLTSLLQIPVTLKVPTSHSKTLSELPLMDKIQKTSRRYYSWWWPMSNLCYSCETCLYPFWNMFLCATYGPLWMLVTKAQQIESSKSSIDSQWVPNLRRRKNLLSWSWKAIILCCFPDLTV